MLLIVVLLQALIGWSKFQIRKRSPSSDLHCKGNIIRFALENISALYNKRFSLAKLWKGRGEFVVLEAECQYRILNPYNFFFEMLFATFCMLYHYLSPRIQINVIWMPGIHTFYKVITILNSFLYGNHITPWLLIFFFWQFLGCNVNCEQQSKVYKYSVILVSKCFLLSRYVQIHIVNP
jgi:hypothetical protein